ncbi:septal ring lytic transglycosylase RlpA family protein [Deferribacter autotrophicus]|uniref:Probable endolytic peptidoglycan transglycosylase RlpA n=1 Tax=Deferribacter autotrophicus TaxID=500465 RepID=A0A5A8F5D5_9BACT|nr:septal ring lytic transglycosylase RlpA family protein [Deferribacter autotrophicus]KAA0258594.1 septal ring lytic transglycosylase RlpA family protein [Deferribacter autotrophicus]
MSKKYTVLFVVAALLLLFNGCAKKHRPPRYNAKGVYYGKPYIIRGKIYYPYTKVKDFEQVGIASWYGIEEHGKLTASGERFNMYSLTAAHKLLPLGSIVHVKNLENGKEVTVRINDRGPFVSGRIIDLSYAAAKKIGIVGKGTAKVKITLLSESPDFYQVKGKRIDFDKGDFAIQIGSFKSYENALRLKNKFKNAKILTAYIRGVKFYRVWLTGFNSLDKANKYLAKIRYKYHGAFITSLK